MQHLSTGTATALRAVGPARAPARLVAWRLVADVRPFRALRYTPAAGPLGTLVSPPYDVISPEQRRGYLAAGPYNAVRLELPERWKDALSDEALVAAIRAGQQDTAQD